MIDPIALLLRPGKSDAEDVRKDVFWLCVLWLLFVATGIGLRDPWPADEPRFALVARDMVAHHQWLIPYVGGDVYADKPPLFFWLIAGLLTLTGTMRLAFLLPSALAALGCVLLVYDLGKRMWNRDVGFAAGLALLVSIQFVWQARQAQIDATLCFFTTLSLYGLLRHLLLGPNWKWYVIGWASAGLGIITKGVGFLPLLVLVPYAVLRGEWQPRPAMNGGWRWALGPLALLAAVSLWGAPMLLAAQGDPALMAYRDEILFKQTVDRYAGAWHHQEPFWYFLVNVIPALWLPLTLLLPWLWPRWRESLRNRDLRVLLPLAWVLLVVLFFSLSSGKRGVYVLPALPALALACAPWLHELSQRKGPQRALFGVACGMAAIGLAGAVYFLFDRARRGELIENYAIDPVAPLFAIGVAAAIACIVTRRAGGFAAYGLVLLATLLMVSVLVNPVINAARSGEEFMRQVQARTAGRDALGIVAYKEQYLLYITRPLWNFGHARWREWEQEAADAAAWMAQDSQRVLLVDDRVRALCFTKANAELVDIANRQQWYLVSGVADAACVQRGKLSAAILYSPPTVK
jgi:4-amino-4-deoxy-L-arabinose transferase-like glycosyltransferase